MIATRASSPAAASPVKLTVVLRRVRPRSSELVGARGALDEHLLDAADASCVALAGDPLGQLDEPLHALDLHLVRNLVGHRAASVPWRGE